MLRLLLNLGISVALIGAVTFFAKRQPVAAGFLTALPLTTMLVLMLTHFDAMGPTERATLAKSVLLGVPLSSTFLLPFVFAPRWNLGFWTCFALGLVLLAGGYGVHRAVLSGT